MNSHSRTEEFLTWLLNHSLQAGLLVVLVLLVQWIFRRQLTSRWRFALWWVVLVRLLLPVGPQSAVSLFNYFHPVSTTPYYQTTQSLSHPQQKAQIRMRSNTLFVVNNIVAPNTQPEVASAQPAVTPFEKASSTAPTAPLPHSRNYRDLILPAAIVSWLAGMALLAIFVMAQILRFQWRLSHSTVPAESSSVDLLRDCQREFGVTRRIEILETDAIGSPALFGLFRLRLLLPIGFTEKFSRNELRYVFLHELAHVKRGDLWLNWLITALQIAHWFNPLIWLGFARLRSDRELACDELALVHAGEKTGTCYGETVVKLLEGLSHPAAIPGLVGILEDKKQMRRRILMIANFKRPGRWSALALLLVTAIAVATLTDAQTENPPASVTPAATTSPPVSSGNAPLNLPEEDSGTAPRPDLHGSVRAKGGGPLSATIFISTATPKVGSSALSPSSYADCSKSATADSEGAFEIKSLNPQLTFRVLATAKGYKPKFVSTVDPAKGPVAIELEPVTAADATPDRSLRGRIVDAKGNPLEGATVEMIGIESKDGGGRYGRIDGMDPMAVTDANGEFSITSQNPFDMMDIRIEARGLALKSYSKLSSGEHHEFTLTQGASLTGRVLLGGKPLNAVAVGVSPVDRSAGHYLGSYQVGTGANGAFTFVNLPPDADFYIYTTMSTTKEFGAVPVQKIHTAADGQATEIGDLIVGPAHRLQGRVVLADGQPVPPKTRVVVGRQDVSDSMALTLDKNGDFDTTGVPSGTVTLGIRVNGYRISAQNKSLDRMNLIFLSGRVDHDITGLVYLLEKGPTVRPDFGGGITEADLPQNRPLRGAEGGMDHAGDWTISGRVVDGETKEPLASFRVTPGRNDSFDRVRWEQLQSVEGTNGSYLVYVNKRVAQPLLKIEADGYLPGSITLVPEDSKSADLALTKGTGPSGIVLDVDGKPAAGATLVLLCDGTDQVSLNSKGELAAYWNENLTNRADASGHFQFKPEWGMKKVAASSPNGFTVVSLDELAAHPEIRLQPFGKITGSLKRASGPGTNEDLDLSFIDKAGRGLPRINLNNYTTTDSEGHFSFEGVPPGPLQLSYRVAMNGQSWRNEPLQQIEVKPGQTLDLQVNASDRVTESADTFRAPPPPKRIPGADLKGFVLLPSGLPAADVKIALQVEGTYLALGKGTLSGNDLRENGLMVSSGPDGSFTLPMHEGGQSLVAASEEGFAQVSLDAFKASPQIILQQWGRVEGTLQINHHPGSNETVVIQPVRQPFQVSQKNSTNGTVNSQPASPLDYDLNSFEAKTDEHGHFAVSFVPPGETTVGRLVHMGNGDSYMQTVARLVHMGNVNSYMHRVLSTINVKAGEPTIFDFASEGRTVTGKLTFSGTNSVDFADCQATLRSPTAKMMAKMRSAKTLEERQAVIESEEFQAATKNNVLFAATLLPDGSFRVEDVPPGEYEFDVQPGMRHVTSPNQIPANITVFNSAHNVTVPPPADNNAPFDLGMIEMQSVSFPTFNSQSAKP